jgi:hypothetical protein
VQPVVLLILAVVWAVFLVPQVVRARAEKTPADSIGAFRNQLSVLQRTTPGSPFGAPRPAYGYMGQPRVSPRELVRRRRQNILFGLLGAMSVTLLLGLLVPKVLVLHAALDALFVAYCALLVRARNLAAERQHKVRYLPGPAMAGEPQLLLRQSGS